MKKILVWDIPTRVFHWAWVVCFAGAWLTAEGEVFRQLHITLGFIFAGLIGFRLIWGVIGSRYARFTAFVRSPAAVWQYLKALLSKKPIHTVGHNPAGALAILALLGLGIGIAVTGWQLWSGTAPEWMEEGHEALATAMLMVVGIHIFAVVGSSFLHKENLVSAMFHGYKKSDQEVGIPKAYPLLGLILFLMILGLGWMMLSAHPFAEKARILSGLSAPHSSVNAASALKKSQHTQKDDDDD